MELFLQIFIGFIIILNVFAVLGYILPTAGCLDEDQIPVEYFLPYLYTNLWGLFREYVNVVGSTILIILLHLTTLPALIITNFIVYIIMVPGKWLIKSFCFIFKNKEKIPEKDLEY